MLALFQNNRHKYHDEILNNIKDNLYRKNRYHFDFALAIAVCDTNISMHKFQSSIRDTDKFIRLEDNLCTVVLDGISSSSAIKASTNLQAKFESEYFREKLYISVIDSSENHQDTNGYKMINSLLDVLEYSISNNISNEVVDYYQMECQG